MGRPLLLAYLFPCNSSRWYYYSPTLQMEKMRHNSIKITQLVSGRGRQNPGQDQTYPLLSLSSSERRGRWQLVGTRRIARDGGRRPHQGWERERHLQRKYRGGVACIGSCFLSHNHPKHVLRASVFFSIKWGLVEVPVERIK